MYSGSGVWTRSGAGLRCRHSDPPARCGSHLREGVTDWRTLGLLENGPPSNRRRELAKQIWISDIFLNPKEIWRQMSRSGQEGRHEHLETSVMNVAVC